MKSIKEKSEEVFPIEEHDSLETELQRRKMRLCYGDGANYVLEEIEKHLDEFANYEDSLIVRRVIEQLKK